MTRRAGRRDDLAGLISDMEPGIRDLVCWARIVDALSISDDIDVGTLHVVGEAMVALAVAIEADWERCFELSGPLRVGER